MHGNVITVVNVCPSDYYLRKHYAKIQFVVLCIAPQSVQRRSIMMIS